MDEDFLKFYEEELRHLRETAVEFGEAHPLVAGQLRLRADGCGDPFVERLLEGFAFLAGRVRQKLDADFPVFAQGLLETLYPNLLAPIPSMGVVELKSSESVTDSVFVERGAQLTGELGERASTRCVFRTAHSCAVYPFQVSGDSESQTRYFDRDLGVLKLPRNPQIKSALRIALNMKTRDGEFGELDHLDDMVFFIRGDLTRAGRIYEEVLAQTRKIYVRDGSGKQDATVLSCGRGGQVEISPCGFEESEALLPTDSRVFSGYRTLLEYGLLPERLMFLRFTGLGAALRRVEGPVAEIILGFGRSDFEMTKKVVTDSFAVNVTPVINLFEMRADQVAVNPGRHEHHVVANKTKPLHYEIVNVLGVESAGDSQGGRRVYEPFYRGSAEGGASTAFFSIRREQRRLSQAERLNGPISRYRGSEAYLTLVNSRSELLEAESEMLSVKALCSNRHLPLSMPLYGSATDLIPEGGTGLESVRWLVPPTEPKEGLVNTKGAWRLLNHLSLNFLSLVDDGGKGTAALRSLLEIYSNSENDLAGQAGQGLMGVTSKAAIRRFPGGGPVAFQRGLEIDIRLDEERFAGSSAFVFGAVLARFLSDHVSINSFTRIGIVSDTRGTLMTWPGRPGARSIV